jgi:XTP/dITP diphosphohydrolase
LRLRLATGNPDKALELARLVRAALGPGAQALEVADLRGLAGYAPPPETGDTYEDNALLKARAVAAADPGAAVLADDSGIEVDALGGGPGVRSARWATAPDGRLLDGPGLNAALLERLAGVPAERRGARMVAVVALVLPGRPPVLSRGEIRGRIAFDQRGSSGFGYDAVFLLPDGRRLSEVPPEVKDALGHRGQAVRGVLPALRQWLGSA